MSKNNRLFSLLSLLSRFAFYFITFCYFVFKFIFILLFILLFIFHFIYFSFTFCFYLLLLTPKLLSLLLLLFTCHTVFFFSFVTSFLFFFLLKLDFQYSSFFLVNLWFNVLLNCVTSSIALQVYDKHLIWCMAITKQDNKTHTSPFFLFYFSSNGDKNEYLEPSNKK